LQRNRRRFRRILRGKGRLPEDWHAYPGKRSDRRDAGTPATTLQEYKERHGPGHRADIPTFWIFTKWTKSGSRDIVFI